MAEIEVVRILTEYLSRYLYDYYSVNLEDIISSHRAFSQGLKYGTVSLPNEE